MVGVDPNRADILPLWKCVDDYGGDFLHVLISNIEPIEDEFENRQLDTLRHAGLNVRKQILQYLYLVLLKISVAIALQ
jgi:hypothetical protein